MLGTIIFKNTIIRKLLTFTVVTLLFGTAVLPILDDNIDSGTCSYCITFNLAP